MAEENQQDNNQQSDNEIILEKLQKDLDSAMNGWKRTAADFENYKKRKEAENKELLEFAREVTVAKLLPTIDTLEQALRHLPSFAPAVAEAMADKKASEGKPEYRKSDESDKSENQSADVVQATGLPGKQPNGLRYGNERIDDFAQKYANWQTGINGILMQLDKALEELGVKKIEAVGKKFDPHFHEAVREMESEQDDGIVVDELQPGFILNGKVIRPSQVVISKKK